ncbi:MAG TPA: hypothetical protein VH518_14350 [Tepidisphaeraceae bacterium]|jgi:hypothetical protein
MRYSVHNLGVELSCQIPALLHALGSALGDFSVGSLVGKTSPIHGALNPFDHDLVRMHLSPTATRVNTGEGNLMELYEEDERFWLIDDHWGLCEINVLRGQFRSWILPEPACDAQTIVEQAVMWPIAQLLRPRGLCLIPAASVVRDGWGVLMLSSFNIEPELTTLVRAGFRVIGQNWTALREQGGHIDMLAMPGGVIRANDRIDLTREMLGSAIDQAYCSVAMIMSPGRRPLPHLRAIAPTNSIGALRRGWPIVELHPLRRPGQMPARLANRARIFDVQLSRNPKDILSLLEAARYHRPQSPARPVVAA